VCTSRTTPRYACVVRLGHRSWASRRGQGLCLLSRPGELLRVFGARPPTGHRLLFSLLPPVSIYPAMKPAPAHGEPTTSSSFSTSSSGRELAVLGSSPPELCAMATEVTDDTPSLSFPIFIWRRIFLEFPDHFSICEFLKLLLPLTF
jgi:hypothetical protein